ncbi:hypothetical protein GA0115233_11886 [Streptomyces sp. DI166]|nr:hypothetical protein GA0115233_11886 [Streptomyces sp. DI166]
MHPMVKPALRRGWRDLNTVQFGMTPAHAMTLGPMDTATGSFLDLLNGTRGPELLRAEGRRMRLPDGHVDGLITRLARAGLLDDARGGGTAGAELRGRKEVLDRLRPDLASLSLTSSEPGEAMRRLAARRSLRVQVRGAGRVGAVLASLLAGRAWARSTCATAAGWSRGTWHRADCPPRQSASAGTRPPAGPYAGRPRPARPAAAPGRLPRRRTPGTRW